MKSFSLWITLAALALPTSLGQQCQDPTPEPCDIGSAFPTCCPKDACIPFSVNQAAAGCCPVAGATVCPAWPGTDPNKLTCCDNCNNLLNPSFTAPSVGTTKVCCPPDNLCPNLGPNGPDPARPPFLCCSTSCLPTTWNGISVNICCPKDNICGTTCCQPGTQCANGQCCPNSQVCTNPTTGAKTCCTAGTTCTSGTCLGCLTPNSLCPNLLNPSVNDCCPPGNCKQLLPLTGTAQACCNQANTCLDADSLPNPVSGCCREPCSTLTKAGQTFSGVCCPTGAQTVTINGVVTRICCPQGTTVQPDGSCKPSSITCALPNVPCNSWPSLATLTCCPEAQCLPVLPLTNTAATACCQQGPVCLDPAQLPNNQVQSCCREPCSTYTVATATGPKRFDNVCCAWPVQEMSTGTGATLRACCPPDQVALSDGTCCRQQQLCGPAGKQVCCPDSQSCQPVLPFSSSGPTACCAQANTCLDPAQLPSSQSRGCCREPCSTLITTAGQNISGVCCPQGATVVTAADGTTSRICCADGFPAQTDGTCCKSTQQCTNSAGDKVCCPAGQSCQNGQCLSTTVPTDCPAPNVTCSTWPKLTPGSCCSNNTCLPGWDPKPAPTGQPLNASACCPAARTCLQYNPLATDMPRVCCKGPCGFVFDTSKSAPIGRRMCCPWTPKLVTGLKLPVCCPDGTTALPDGSCCKPSQVCPQPNGQPRCCADGLQCNLLWPPSQDRSCCNSTIKLLDPLPAPLGTLNNFSVCDCPLTKRCKRYSPVSLPTPLLGPDYCCNGTCAFVLWPSVPGLRRMCCPYPLTASASGDRFCCPPNNVIVNSAGVSRCCPKERVFKVNTGTACCPADAVPLGPSGPCCRKNQVYTDEAGNPACCPDGTSSVDNTCCKPENICPRPGSTVNVCCTNPYGCNTRFPPNSINSNDVCCPAARRCQTGPSRWECCRGGQSCGTVTNLEYKRCVTSAP